MMYKDYFIFDGVPSSDFGMYTFGSRFLKIPKVDIKEVVIPGRSGVLHQYNDRFGNAAISYSVVSIEDRMFSDIPLRFTDMIDFILSRRGYHRLEDTFRPEEYRMAVYKGGDEIKSTLHDEIAGMEIEFDARPERWLKEGEIRRECKSGGILFNPTQFTAKPLLRAYGTGTFTVSNSSGSTSVKINSANGYTDIDCELQEAFKGAVNCNGNIQLLNGEFPGLVAGENKFRLQGINHLEVVPRWYKL